MNAVEAGKGLGELGRDRAHLDQWCHHHTGEDDEGESVMSLMEMIGAGFR